MLKLLKISEYPVSEGEKIGQRMNQNKFIANIESFFNFCHISSTNKYRCPKINETHNIDNKHVDFHSIVYILFYGYESTYDMKIITKYCIMTPNVKSLWSNTV